MAVDAPKAIDEDLHRRAARRAAAHLTPARRGACSARRRDARGTNSDGPCSAGKLTTEPCRFASPRAPRNSRQLAVYGRETMRRLASARILVAGLNGLGVEIGATAPPLL